MRVDVDEQGNLLLKEIYCNTILQTAEGNQLSVCMRDDSFELCVVNTGKIVRINPINGEIETWKLPDTKK